MKKIEKKRNKSNKLDYENYFKLTKIYIINIIRFYLYLKIFNL